LRWLQKQDDDDDEEKSRTAAGREFQAAGPHRKFYSKLRP